MNAAETFEVVVIGGGPAGLSAALYLGRARRRTLVVDAGDPRNAGVSRMHGYPTREGASPAEMHESALAELRAFPHVEYRKRFVSTLEAESAGYLLRTAEGETIFARRVLFATGMRDALPDVSGLRERWGKSVFVCPFCDGWELRDRRILVYGRNRDAVELAQELYGWTHRLAICFQVDDRSDYDRRWLDAAGADVYFGTLDAIEGAGEGVERVRLADGTSIEAEAVFLSVPLRQKCAIAEQAGCEFTPDNEIAVDGSSQTTLRGCYAAGDAVTHLHQVVIAAASGAKTAIAVNCDLLAEEALALMAMPARA